LTIKQLCNSRPIVHSAKLREKTGNSNIGKK